jgi:uncharacterized Ntn-hydrolase superfamily protein
MSRLSLRLSFVAALCLLPPTASASVAPEAIATFSAVAYDPATGEVGVAVQSRFFAVGSVVPSCLAGIGGVASQAFGQPTYGPRGLKLLQEGYTPDEVLQVLLLNDANADQRQLGIVSARDKGDAATYTGRECLNWAGGRTGVAPDGVVYSVQGNILTGADVIEAMAAAMEDRASVGASLLSENEQKALAVPGLAGRLLGALLAGQSRGGDSRGMQSAALKVSQADAGYGGYNDVKYDLRVDDAVDPFEELARILNLAYPIALTNEAYRVLYAGDYGRAERAFRNLINVEPASANHHYNLACALSLGGRPAEALEELRIALRIDPKMASAAVGDPDLKAVRALPEGAALLSIPPDLPSSSMP